MFHRIQLWLFGALLSVMLTAPLLSNAASQPGPTSVTLPGTGVRIVPPTGTHLGPAGSLLIDESGETIINFVMSDTKFSLENDPTWRGLYKRPPEHISLPGLSGNLYRRTRAADGGAWDGWFFAIPRAGKVLTVMASYTGKSPEAFDRMRENFLSISWDESVSDPEAALGVKVSPRGLRSVSGVFGALSYNEAGVVGSAGPSLLLQSLPIPIAKANAIFPAGCASLLGAAFSGKPFIGPEFLERGTVRLCEAWSKQSDNEMRYVAFVRLPSGALINVMGTSSFNRFQESLVVFRTAIANLQPLPSRSSASNVR